MCSINKCRLVDWFFRRVIEMLNDADVKIRTRFRKFNKQAPKKYRKKYSGQLGHRDILEDDTILITIESRVSERTKIRTFLHELLHVMFENSSIFIDVDNEREIIALEMILWPILREDQKQFLKEYMYELSG